MVKSELNKRSPLRIFENSINGGVGKGNIGVLASRKGVGKTACLVHIAMDKLFRGRHVIHVSFSSKVDHISMWYEDIFKEIAKKRELENAVDVHDEIIKNRVIMNFNQDGIETEKILKSISAMIEHGHFAADAVIIDGYDYARASHEDLLALQSFAKETNLEIWTSVSLQKDEPYDENGMPIVLKDYVDSLAVVVTLQYEGDYVHLKAVKDHDDLSPKEMELKLDPKSLLIAEM
ncbi:MAG: hypothetical protein PQJ61_16320 [Spirochaetales bacterium]|uniref:SF4 helicase domain-containing protein n=1 Tax=Candidatus Thalassospirochaeta sargassi TaxID=3119039 RepID=A0AAJ1IFH3_9SPIO|nr:hypothetical protein [Spirochaetales bacterium]